MRVQTPPAPAPSKAPSAAATSFDASQPSVVVVRTSGGGFMVGHVEGTNLPDEARAAEQLASTLIAKLVSHGFSVATAWPSSTGRDGDSELIYTLVRQGVHGGAAAVGPPLDSARADEGAPYLPLRFSMSA
jgi:hypothetical protein